MSMNVSVKTLYEGWSKFLLAKVRLADGKVIEHQIEDHGRAVSVLPYDPQRRCAMLIRQFRAPVYISAGRDDLLEAIAGIVDEDDVAAAARREALEEAGLKLAELNHVGCLWSMPGIATERMDLFLAVYREADRTGAGGGLPEEHEDITAVEIPLTELAVLADSGGIDDMKTFALIQTLRLRRPDLFA
jgi:nudix-type nucleoside diphosphatase (YffH/AdpP family)